MPLSEDVFLVPIGHQFLLHAPRQAVTSLINARAAQALQAPTTPGTREASPVHMLRQRLGQPARPAPAPRSGPLHIPLFLGLIPTRGCNLGCRYCDFAAPKSTSSVMPLPLARAAIEAYLHLAHTAGVSVAAIHFFGGEPMFAPEVVHFAVPYARMRAAELGLAVHFEVTTNGVYSAQQAQWVAENFDAVVLSIDGPADVQDAYRPALNQHSAFASVERTAHILSTGAAKLIIRACVTADTAPRLLDIARWLSETFHPQALCFETLTASPASEAAGLRPPSPWEFARAFCAATEAVAEQGLEVILSTSDVQTNRAAFCPVSQDALIVTPEGEVKACYLLPEQWQQRGFDLCLGRLEHGQLSLGAEALARARALTVYAKPECARCFCRYHCAGGCPVNHPTAAAYDDLCLQTRVITAASLLRRLGQGERARAWLADESALRATAYQADDRWWRCDV